MTSPTLRLCRAADTAHILDIINDGARAYRGVVPADCLHVPYMSLAELEAEMAAGVVFHGCDIDGRLAGVMGLQAVRDVHLIRHAYVRTACQGQGIGGRLLTALRPQAGRLLVGTWAAADWAIAFYRRHGFTPVAPERTPELLQTYWTVSARQIETSVVLESIARVPDGVTSQGTLPDFRS